MPTKTLLSSSLGDMLIQYHLDEDSKAVGFQMIPSRLVDDVVTPRTSLKGSPEVASLPQGWLGWTPGRTVQPLVQIKCVGDDYPDGFAQGRTMQNSGTTLSLAHDSQVVDESNDITTITTKVVSPRGFSCEHILTWQGGDPFVEVHTVLHNDGGEPLVVEMISSFSLGGISPFHAADAPNRLFLHRLRSGWCAEGRLDTHSIESLGLERSWSGHSPLCERFGQVGSMPARGFFPFVAIEDRGAGVFWGAQLAWAGSWQMEVYRKDDALCLSGGLADFEFGHWMKRVEPGERFVSPTSILSVAHMDIDGFCQRLTAAQKRPISSLPAVEQELPVVCNDWLPTCGKTSEADLLRIADRIANTNVRYLVLDAGWYCAGDSNWLDSLGDWVPSPQKFPCSLKTTAQAIRDRGIIPGIWFEIETAGSKSRTCADNEHFLTRHGVSICAGQRRFWDLREPAIVRRLAKTVLDLVETCGFGYLKVDYNETIGIGVDGAESLGEGLRQHIEGIYELFDTIRQRLPELVIEICSAGGHRLEPSMMARGSMGSVSDAFELRELPVIAGSLHRSILPQQALIWVVLRRSHDQQRLDYVLGAGFLGRMCPSGEIADLDKQQWNRVLSALDLYQRVHNIIRDGLSQRFGTAVTSLRHVTGWQAVLRLLPDNSEGLVVIHTFAGFQPKVVHIRLPRGSWTIAAVFGDLPTDIQVSNGQLACHLEGEYVSCVIHVRENSGRGGAIG